MPASIDVLWVHVPCGGLRGSTTRGVQTCRCQPSQDPWPGCDVSEVAQLCVVCARATAGGTTRWSWEACGACRRLNRTLEERLGRRGLPLGRHSIMNGVAHRIASATEASTDAFGAAVQQMVVDWEQLTQWRLQEVQRLAASAGLPDKVLLTEWSRQFPSGRQASRGAFSRLLATYAGPPDVTAELDPGDGDTT